MQVDADRTVHLLDAKGRQIGQIAVERTDDELICGTFIPGPAFGDVQPLFQQFEDAVNLQALHRVDELDAAIGALGLHICLPDGSRNLFVHDVQIWTDGNITCRLTDRTRSPLDHRLLTPEPVPTAIVTDGSS